MRIDDVGRLGDTVGKASAIGIGGVPGMWEIGMMVNVATVV